MRELEAVCRKLDRIEGNVLALESLLLALCEVVPAEALPVVQAFLASELEAVRHQLQSFSATRSTVESFELGARRVSHKLNLVGE